MNNQVGAVVAEVLRKLDNVAVTPLPSMIRIDGTGRFDLVYADVDDAAGEETGWFDAAEFEENMSPTTADGAPRRPHHHVRQP